MEPRRYKRRILLAVTGLTPQVVTETLYALAVRRQPAFVPTEIRLLTTKEGAERARLSLLSTDPGWFYRVVRDYGLPEIAFGPDSIQVLRDQDGAAIDDIRTLADNQRAADGITELVRTLTTDPDTALHVSIAGGRKTMGYYLGYALSLFGRPQDRLSHVLVSEPFESSWDFFYPTPYSRVITTRDNKLADTANAEVTLAEIPFVRLRDGLPDRLLAGKASFGQTVAAAQRALERPRLMVNLGEPCIYAGGERVELTPASLAFFSMMARRKLRGLHTARWDTEGIDRQYLAEYRRIVGPMSGELARAEEALADGMTQEYFEQRKSRTNAAMEEVLGQPLAALYSIHSDGRKPRTRFGLRIDAGAIRFVGSGDESASLRDGPNRSEIGENDGKEETR